MLAGMEEVGTGLLDRLDAMQRVAASAPGGPLLVVAGPGTGKTRTLTHRIAYLCAELNVVPEQCLAITFTRRAAEEMRHRLAGCSGRTPRTSPSARSTRSACPSCARTPAAAGLPADFRVADDAERAAARTRGRRRPGRATRRCCASRTWSTSTSWSPCRSRCCAATGSWSSATGPAGAGSSSTSTRTSTPPSTSCCGCSSRRRQPLRDRRPGPGDLLVPGRRRRVLPALLAGLHRRPAGPADPQLPLVRADPGGRGAGDRADLAGAGPPAGPGPAGPGGAAGRPHSAASVADEAEFVVRTIDELVGGLSHRSFDSGRVDGRSQRDAVLLRHRRALPHRRPGGADRGRAGPGRHPGAEALARPAARPARRWPRSPASCATPTGCDGSLAARVRARRAGARRSASRCPTLDGAGAVRPEEVCSAVELLTAAGPALRRRPGAVPAASSRPAPRSTRSTRAPRRSRCSPCTRRRAWSGRWCSWSAARTGCCRCACPAPTPDDDAVAEERRLFFVGLTRAQGRLSCQPRRRGCGTGGTRVPARTPFLDADRPRAARAPRRGRTPPARGTASSACI